MPVYELQEEHKQFLRDELGELYTGGTPQENCEWLLEDIDRPLYVVGDYSARQLLDMDADIDIIVYDGHTRKEDDIRAFSIDGYTQFHADNPAGQISDEAYDTISEAVQQTPAMVEIDGEEDLLTLAVIDSVEDGANIVYGDPGINGPAGIRLVEVDDEVRQAVERLLDGGETTA